MTAQVTDSFINQNEAAAFLNLSPKTLEGYRVRGGGPLYYKLGRRVAYRQCDLMQWASERMCGSTSQNGGAAIHG